VFFVVLRFLFWITFLCCSVNNILSFYLSKEFLVQVVGTVSIPNFNHYFLLFVSPEPLAFFANWLANIIVLDYF